MRSLVPLTALALVSVAPGTVVTSAGAQTPRHLVHQIFARVADEERQPQIMDIGPGTTPGSMLVLTRRSVHEFDATGTLVRKSRFPDELWLPVSTRFSPDQPLHIVGLRSGFFRSWVDVLDIEAQRIARLKGWQYGSTEVADVVDGPEQEVLVRYRDGVSILSARGAPKAFIKAPRYLYHFHTILVAPSAKRAIAMWMWRDAKRGADIAVYGADGGVVGEWNENPSERFAVLALHDDEEGLWSAVGDEFVQRAATGVVRRRLRVPGMGHYRYVHGAPLSGERSVFVGSAPGSTSGSIICVFDRDGTVLARATLPLQSWAFFAPDPKGTVFFVGTGDRVLRYDVASLP